MRQNKGVFTGGGILKLLRLWRGQEKGVFVSHLSNAGDRRIIESV